MTTLIKNGTVISATGRHEGDEAADILVGAISGLDQ